MNLTDDDKQWIDDRLERLETKLLTAFHQWASPMAKKQHSHREAISALDDEVELLKSQVKELFERIK